MSRTFPRRGEVYWVNLDPTIGSEIARTRPCAIISNDVGNQYASRVIVAPLTTGGTDRVYPFEVLVPVGAAGVTQTSKVVLDQVRTVDKRRLGRYIGVLDNTLMQAVNLAIRRSLAVESDDV
ncbi:MAG: type II toxin-antitoxin system PemK/MazF family toxin [Chloroflexi bacterium]|nr:type II toxin-antitoxin system PemK/MazF family toxin [Chloroflexota bacterium]